MIHFFPLYILNDDDYDSLLSENGNSRSTFRENMVFNPLALSKEVDHNGLDSNDPDINCVSVMSEP